ncbi:iron ABC transporter permease [Microcoleus sp. FACHB-1515]|uniref:FecCD family ABC transporter permease n=1 Tax=Cyanophyceae TaxID=3028117 RepID=UPI001687F1C8|nr:iron ABC transporter permease [Microcoleus sp. FACHB-1515]MBD2091510.1 iron ABC transporter permease [Microcoleus sp. FACHB-1515]
MTSSTLRSTPVRRSPPILLLGLGVGAVILFGCLVLSLTLGAADIPPATVISALFAFDGSTEHLIIRTVRLPRSLIAIAVGGALSVAGALMQGLTRNPLAAPDILGVDAGAAFAVVVAVFLFGSESIRTQMGVAFLGAGIVAIAVYGIGSLGRGGLTPLNLTIAGAALTALIASLTAGILIVSQRTLEEIRFWLAGSVAGRDLDLLWQALPFLAIGLALALALGRPITAMSLGDDVARSLGQRTGWVKGISALSVVLLAGGSVAVAGPIGFVGLIIPHLVRFFVGVDYRWIVPYSAVFGAILLVVADICARLILRPIELPVGLVMPLIGAPFFVYLTHQKVKQ